MLHVDQVGWSNIGKNWAGHKVLCLWEYGAASNAVLDKFLDHAFVPVWPAPSPHANPPTSRTQPERATSRPLWILRR
eukprot:SAG22_NODE_3790_length_1530_cov_1.915444_2_plen_77_part_00